MTPARPGPTVAEPQERPIPDKTPNDTYLKTLLLYHEEEIMGDAWFRALALRFTEPERQQQMTLLADVEAAAAASVVPLLEKYALIPRPEADLFAIGRAHARQSPGDWSDLLDTMRDTFPGYIDDFHALRDMAPNDDRAALEILTLHEVAAIEYLNLEHAGDAEAVRPLREYLRIAAGHGAGQGQS